MKKRMVAMVVALAATAVGGGQAEGEGVRPSRWDLRVGYGYQYTNSSRPNNFQVVSLMPSVVVPLTDTIGSKLMRGHFDWNPELDLALFIHPYTRPKIGLTPLQFHWEWETPWRIKPYLTAGAGFLYANVNRRETRSDWNFNLQGGVGVYWQIAPATSLVFEYRHVHISNAGLHEDNAGINNHNFLVGVSLRR